MKRNLQVCLTPKLFNLCADKKSIVVIVDVLRATSTMCIAFENGVERIIPVSKIEEALEYKNSGKDFIIAAERNGKAVKGFDFGNSPQSYVNNDVKGRTVVITTTNGTRAINIAKKGHEVVVGSFLNLQAIAEWLISRDKDVIIFCAGWKDKFNLEDTLFAGALCELLVESKLYDNSCDAAQAAEFLWESAQGDLFAFLENSSHRKRLSNLNIDSDIHFCLQMNQSNKVPILIGKALVVQN